MDRKADEKKRILELLPEVSEIRDADLRNKVIDVWIDLWHQGNYEDVADAVYAPELPDIALISHMRIVTRNAMAIAQHLKDMRGISVNEDRLVAACLLHDASKVVEYGRTAGGYEKTRVHYLYPHAFLTGESARKAGIDEEIVHIILTHSPHMPVPPGNIEGVVLHYADLVDGDCLCFVRNVALGPMSWSVLSKGAR